jgi:hypothetical protein
MAWTLIANAGAGTTGGANSTITTGAIDTTGSELLVLAVCSFTSGGVMVPTDSAGNYWAAMAIRTIGNVREQIFFAFNALTSGSHTFTVDGASSFPSIAVGAFHVAAGVAAIDQESGSSGATLTSIQPGSITPSANDSLIVSALGFEVTTTVSVDSSLSITDQVNYSAANHFGVALAYFNQPTIAWINPTWSWSGSSSAATGLAAFIAFGSAPGGGGEVAYPFSG